MNAETRKRLRRVMVTINEFIADARVSLEYNRAAAKPDFPGDPTVMEVATRLSQLEAIRLQIIDTYPSLASVGRGALIAPKKKLSC